MTKSERLNIRIDPELMAKIKAAADKENRSVTNWIENVLKEKIKQGK